MEAVFTETVMNAFWKKAANKLGYDKNILQSTWEDMNKTLVKEIMDPANLHEMPKKNAYITCTYRYEKGDKSGKCCGKMVKNIGQERCYLHNEEKMEKRKAEAKKKLEERKAKVIEAEVEKKLQEKLTNMTINQTVVKDNDIVSNAEVDEHLVMDYIQDSEEDDSGNDD